MVRISLSLQKSILSKQWSENLACPWGQALLRGFSTWLCIKQVSCSHTQWCSFLIQVMTTFMPPPPAATFLAFHPQDNNIIAIGMEDSSIQIYNVRVDEVCGAMWHSHLFIIFNQFFNLHHVSCIIELVYADYNCWRFWIIADDFLLCRDVHELKSQKILDFLCSIWEVMFHSMVLAVMGLMNPVPVVIFWTFDRLKASWRDTRRESLDWHFLMPLMS